MYQCEYMCMLCLFIPSWKRKQKWKCETKKDNNKAIFDVHFSTGDFARKFPSLLEH